ncbi:MAG TPA: transcriptional regulator [Methylomirabilota bacterium]|nr:transcriptional regulator [Methylomirabilota bacterium]
MTVRSALRDALRTGSLTARELSARVGIPEKQVAGHLEHLDRSLRAAGERLHVEPACCLDCGFVFRKRDRLSRPSRCPVCRSEHLDGPRFAIVPP